MTEPLKIEINAQLYEHIDDSDIATGIYDLVGQLDREHDDAHLRTIERYEKRISILDAEIVGLKKEMADDKRQINNGIQRGVLLDKALKEMAIVRQAMNRLFNDLWLEHQPTIQSLNPDFDKLAQATTELKRPDRVWKSDGIKYALCVINGLCNHVPKDLCTFYIRLNDRCHPPINPKKVIIDSLDSLKGIINQGALPDYYKESGLTTKILCDLERIIRSRKAQW